MYRYSVDNAVTYTSEDFVLFRESPFACWMERLSLENPEHGIPPDVGSPPPDGSIERQDDMADTLLSEGKDVRLIDWDADEPERRSATLDAMRKGADFIVNGQLALGPLSGAANLLVRTSGYSELGDFLYVPCDTQARTNLHSEFRLCFLADLLHSLQGQLPPQMLVIRGGDDLVPLETESHIYHYRAVKQRFMESMRGFRKHRMPDPAESAHFGRWSDCAHEVLKQRLLREDQLVQEITDEDYHEPVLKAAGVAAGSDTTLDLEDSRPNEPEQNSAGAVLSASADGGADTQNANTSGFTLAEQAHMLTPGTYTPGPGFFRLGRPQAAKPKPSDPIDTAGAEEDAIAPIPEAPTEAKPKYNRRASDKALQNLEFIGSSVHVSGMILDTAPAPQNATAEPEQSSAISTAPAPSLRDPRSREATRDDIPPVRAPDAAPGHDAMWVLPMEDEIIPAQESQARRPGPDDTSHQASRPSPVAHSSIDMDATHLASPQPVLATSDSSLSDTFGMDDHEVEHGFGQAAGDKRKPELPLSDSIFNDRLFTGETPAEEEFSSNLITSDDYEN